MYSPRPRMWSSRRQVRVQQDFTILEYLKLTQPSHSVCSLVKTCNKKPGNRVSNIALTIDQVSTDSTQENCLCGRLHIPPTCRHYADRRACPDGARCKFGHDMFGQNTRRRKADEHSEHHPPFKSARSLVGVNRDSRAVDNSDLEPP